MWINRYVDIRRHTCVWRPGGTQLEIITANEAWPGIDNWGHLNIYTFQSQNQ